jgi:hypothetical protein
MGPPKGSPVPDSFDKTIIIEPGDSMPMRYMKILMAAKKSHEYLFLSAGRLCKIANQRAVVPAENTKDVASTLGAIQRVKEKLRANGELLYRLPGTKNFRVLVDDTDRLLIGLDAPRKRMTAISNTLKETGDTINLNKVPTTPVTEAHKKSFRRLNKEVLAVIGEQRFVEALMLPPPVMASKSAQEAAAPIENLLRRHRERQEKAQEMVADSNATIAR